MGSGKVLSHAVERPGGHAVLDADAAHHADALGLDEYPAFLVLARADNVAEIIVGAAEPRAVPGVLDDHASHLLRLGAIGRRIAGQAAPFGDHSEILGSEDE